MYKWIYLSLLMLCVEVSFQSMHDNEVEEESNPLLDIASAFLQETGQGNGNGLAAVGGLVSSFMQSDTAKQIGDALAGSGGSAGGNGAADILSGIGSLLSSATAGSGSRSGGGIDPSMILNMIQMFSGAASEQARPKRSQQRNQPPPPSNKNNEIGLDSIISVASSFMNGGRSNTNSESGVNMEAVMSLLPTIMNTIQAFTGPEAAKREETHSHHNYVLPPIFETLHIYWDHFMNSELGIAVWKKTGMKEITASFSDEKGNINYQKMFDMMENLSFRRKWIKTATSHIAKLIAYLADSEVQSRYLKTFEVVSNGFLKQYGYPKSAFFDAARPEESLTDFANTAIRRHFEVKVDSGAYIKPAVAYVKDLIKLGQSQGYLGKLNSEELSDKVTDALNLDIIEPFLKVYRGYRYAVVNPECASYVMCELNAMDPRDSAGLPTFKSGLTKLSSFAASWFLSSETNNSFFTLYAAANVPANCQKKYPVDCSDFHVGEERVTTEYFHNEL